MPTANCKNCSIEFKHTYQTTGVYCSIQCTKDGQRKEKRLRFLEGKIVGRGHLRNHLVDINGWKCMVCNLETWMGDLIPLEVDHINGDAGNNLPANLRLICPNCHSQTPTHKAKNKGNGRGSRGLPLY